jgi:hypothetical protein
MSAVFAMSATSPVYLSGVRIFIGWARRGPGRRPPTVMAPVLAAVTTAVEIRERRAPGDGSRPVAQRCDA